MHCPLFSHAWGQRLVSNEVYKYNLAIVRSIFDTGIVNYNNTVVHITAYNPHIQMACDIGEQIL